MNINLLRHRRNNWGWLLLSLGLFLFYLYYGFLYVFITPYSGLAFASSTGGWLITDSQQPNVSFGDVILEIGDLDFEIYLNDWSKTPFLGYSPGDVVSLRLADGGATKPIVMPEPSLIDQLLRVVNMSGWFLPFWFLGTAVILFLRPMDNRWRLLILTMYLISIWTTTNLLAGWQLGASRLLYGMVSYLLAGVLVHLHLVAPQQMNGRWIKTVVKFIYAVVLIVCVLEIFHLPSRTLPANSVMLGLLTSFFLLTSRLVRTRDPAEKTASRLMLTGILFGFGPGILVQMLTNTIDVNINSSLGYVLAVIALPALPIFYLYAIFKRQLGGLELRANRLLSVYSFLLFYPPLFLMLILFGERLTTSGSGRTAYLLFVSTMFVILMPPLLARYQQWVNRLAYGTTYNPDELLRLFASRIPTTRRRPDFVALLKQEILPSLLIRQSALILTNEGTPTVMYAQGWSQDDVDTAVIELSYLYKTAGIYRPPYGTGKLPWLRLIVPVSTGNQEIGAWLFGSRDPDDFYTVTDIELLQTLANQIAPVIENIALYENLEAQVARRTAELEAERDRTQAILESAGEGIFFTDTVGRLMYINTAMARLANRQTDDGIGISLLSWIDDDQTAADAISEALQNREGWSGETVWRRHNGHTLDIHLTLAPLRHSSQTVTGFVGVLSDISRLKEVDRLKSNIIGNVSHELKTPLTNIMLYISLIEKSNPEHHGRYIDIIRQETNRLTQLIQDLLDLSKLESGEVSIELKSVDVYGVVDQIMTATAPRFEQTGLVSVVNLPPDLPPVLADAGQIKQVVTNLVANALNYVPAPGTVTLSAGTGVLDGHQAVWLQVSDDGPGIPDYELSQLFERFFRGEGPKQKAIAGTGLGLAICKEIIDRHQGRIVVESQEGEGAAFTIWLRKAAGQRP